MKHFVSLLFLVFLAAFWRRGEANVGHQGGGHYDNAVADGHHSERGEEGRHSVHALDAHTHAEQHKKEHNYEDEYGNRDHLMDSSGRKKGLLKAFDAHSAFGRHSVKDTYFKGFDHGSHYDKAFKGHGAGGGHGHVHAYQQGFNFGPGHGLGHQMFGHGAYGRESFGHAEFAHGNGFGHLGFGGKGGFGHTVLGHVIMGNREYGHY
ncbi:Hypothetical predicted protein [Octopus vulgaris]|uniref:Uncharacterized protein n=1 Tax=Octopus vulgaris TaxID=6645 RepID=A0AA36BSB1_OCTVU|nr:Hypothetical predicted protein [Octopus vulgaris]